MIEPEEILTPDCTIMKFYVNIRENKIFDMNLLLEKAITRFNSQNLNNYEIWQMTESNDNNQSICFMFFEKSLRKIGNEPILTLNGNWELIKN